MIKLFLFGRCTIKYKSCYLPFSNASQRFLSSRSDIIETIQKYLDEPLPLTPKPQEYESLWSEFWKVSNLNSTRLDENVANSYSLLFPPPNITGQLHLGHALTLALQDAYIRHQKMFSQANVTFIPGFDHAGIATYLVLDKTVKASLGKSLKELSREEQTVLFNKWKDDRITDMKSQLDRLGASLDYSKAYFTLDPDRSNSVNHAFIDLHRKGYIYRSNSLINWSYFLQSALSDLEVKYRRIDGGTSIEIPGYPEKVDFGYFHTFLFPLLDGQPGEGIKVSTMNLYTIPGDVAIAVHPEDSRYVKYHNKLVYNPITEKPIPVIIDEHAKMDFGSGAVKITPASSFTDYEIAVKHGLPINNFLNSDGSLLPSAVSPRFSHLLKLKHRYDIKKEIFKILQEMNLYVGSEARATIVPFCKRSGDVIEHRLMPQWFLDVKPGYDLLRARIENNAFDIFPPKKVNLLLEWFDKKRDWCLSRQIPFGHQVPAWKAVSGDKETWFVARSEKRAIKMAKDHFKGKDIRLEQDPDVLDTWFSSALLPLSALGWPNTESPMFKNFYPLSLMETGFDIITFWVMRMALLSLYLTGRLPFSKVYLHGMVCDTRGKKMSKSEGNIINPIDVIDGVRLESLQAQTEKLLSRKLLSQEEYENAIRIQKHLFPRGIAPCGSDGLRLSLYQHNSTNEKIGFGVNQMESNRHLINKIWQAYRFFLFHLKEVSNSEVAKIISCENDLIKIKDQLTPMDKWIICQFYLFIKDLHHNVEHLNLTAVYKTFYKFWINCFCDNYIEAIKGRVDFPASPVSLAVWGQLFKSTMIAMHPFIPFVSEELYQRFKRFKEPDNNELKSIQTEPYPNIEIYSQFMDENLIKQADALLKVKHILGRFKATCDLSKADLIQIPIKIYTKELIDKSLRDTLKRIGASSNLTITDNQSDINEDFISLHATHNTIILIPANETLAIPLLNYLEKAIIRLQTDIIEHRQFEDRSDAAEELEKVTLDRDHLLIAMEKLKEKTR